MNDKFDKPAERLLRPSTLVLLSLIIARYFAATVRADDFTRGPLLNLSQPEPFAGCSSSLPGFFIGAQLEPSIVVNPTNPNNLAAVWIAEQWKGVAPAVSLDGGVSWHSSLVPSLTLCSGGTAQGGGGDPSLSFAPNGDLYFVGGLFTVGSYNAIVVSKSIDGGLNWSAPIFLAESDGKKVLLDKMSVTADPTDARYAYAVWTLLDNGNRGVATFSRTTDGGQTWEPARTNYDPGTSDQAIDSTVVVLPSGVVLDFFIQIRFANDSGGSQKKEGSLLVIRSNDKGQSWSGPIGVAAVPIFNLADPETGQAIINENSYPPFFRVAADSNSGRLYAVWEETRFNSGLYSSIAFSMSGDGGVSWSTPIPVNKTPSNIRPRTARLSCHQSRSRRMEQLL